jgi:hypothetical protein
VFMNSRIISNTVTRKMSSHLTVREMCGTNVTRHTPAVNDCLIIQVQMATVGHPGETELTVTHLLTQVRGFADLREQILLPGCGNRNCLRKQVQGTNVFSTNEDAMRGSRAKVPQVNEQM